MSAATSALDTRLSPMSIKPPLQQAIIQQIFQSNHSTNLDAYFRDWFEEQCDAATGQVSVQTHREILRIVSFLQANLSRGEIVTKLHVQCGDEDLVAASIDLAARIWLTLSIGTLPNSLSPGTSVAWNDGCLSSTVHSVWSLPQLSDSIKLPKSFHAANIEKIAGIKIEWTSNLADHLRLEDDDTRVLIYHQLSFLEIHKEDRRSIFPDGLIEETICTMGLLIPSADKTSRNWFHKKQKELGLDPKAGTYGPLNAAKRQIEHFKYWRDRLTVLKQTFDESEPKTISLWWYDDRKKVQWYTFWIAALVLLLTILFGLTQSVAGVVQAWAAVRSLSD
ncbi:hypothetical protein JMJ35_005122 [Cladonia borealis]|uniref:Uncharacterized protein n=1 Tax=Cladonia borealis TaxID=184061 RepID=A0AA39V513_9LECA|nr:hypothetical protein JMJ35_005122 [Cladonia borealis]